MACLRPDTPIEGLRRVSPTCAAPPWRLCETSPLPSRDTCHGVDTRSRRIVNRSCGRVHIAAIILGMAPQDIETRNIAVERRQAIVLSLSAGGVHRRNRNHAGRFRGDGVHEMISRSMVGILSAAILSSGVLTWTSVTAEAQAQTQPEAQTQAQPPAQ